MLIIGDQILMPRSFMVRLAAQSLPGLGGGSEVCKDIALSLAVLHRANHQRKTHRNNFCCR